MTQLAKQAKAASRDLSRLTAGDKNACLLAMADALEQNATAIKEANALDMEVGAKMGLSSAMLDRLKLDDKRITAHGQGPARSGRAARPGGPGAGRTRPPQRPEAAEGQHANRGGGHHLRVAAQCDGGRRQPVFQVRQRDRPARGQGGTELEPRGRADHDRGGQADAGGVSRARDSGGADDRPRGHQGTAVADAIRGFVHAAGRRRALSAPWRSARKCP